MKFTRPILYALLIFILVNAVGWLVLNYTESQETQKLDIKTQIVAEQVGIRLQEFLNTRISRLDYFREYLENVPQIDENDFRSRALLIQHELTGFQAVSWIDKQGIIQWVTPVSSNLGVVGVDLIERAARGAAEAFGRTLLYKTDSATPLINLMQGGKGFATYLPVISQGEVQGFINGVFRVEELIFQCLGNTVRNYNYEVLIGGETAYLAGERGNFSNPKASGRYNFNLLGQAWELQIVPGSSAGNEYSELTLYSHLGVVVLALVMAVFAHFRLKSQAEITRAYEQIGRSETKFRAIFDKSPAGLIRFNRDALITDWNKVAGQIFNLEFPSTHPRKSDEFHELAPFLDKIHACLEGTASSYDGYVFVDRERLEVEVAIEPLISNKNDVDGGIILVKDVTEEKATLHAREVMFEIGELTKGGKDLPLLFEAIQKSLSRLLDTRNFYIALYDRDEDEISFSFFRDEFDTPPPKPLKKSSSLSAYILREGQARILTKQQIYDLHEAGEIELKGTPAEQWVGAPLEVEGETIGLMAIQSYSKDTVYHENDLNVLRFVSSQIATTIQIHIEDEKLRKSEALHRKLSLQLTESNNIKALLLDVITHDLKNPAGVISSMADLLVSEEATGEEIKLIKDSSDALLKVIENTTSLARVTLGEVIGYEAVNISELVRQVGGEFKSSFEAQGKPLEANIEDGITLQANPIIAEVFRNYLSNALKYSPAGKPVTLNLVTRDDMVEFEVGDQGKGIIGNDRESIFQRSVQLENGRSRGSGLGLAIVKRIAEVHHASVGVRANNPQGNIFYMKIKKLLHIEQPDQTTGVATDE